MALRKQSLSSIADLLALKPQNESIFIFFFKYIEARIYIMQPQYLTIYLVFMGNAYILVLIYITSFAIWFFSREKDFRVQHLWFIRKRYPHKSASSSHIPYLVPNGTFALATFHFLAALIYSILIIIEINPAFKKNFQIRALSRIVLTFIWLPGFWGAWLSSFGAIYAWLAKPNRRHNKWLENSILLNFSALILPFLVSLQAFIGSSTVIRLIPRLDRSHRQLYSHLKEAILYPLSGNIPLLIVEGKKFIDIFQVILAGTRWMGACWLITSLTSACLLAFGFGLIFFALIRFTSMQNSPDSSESKGSPRERNIPNSQKSKLEMTPDHQNLLIQSIITLAGLIWNATIGLVILLHPLDYNLDPYWSSVFTIMTHGTGLIFFIVLILQTYRLWISYKEFCRIQKL